MHPDGLPRSTAQVHGVANHFDVNVYITGVEEPELSCRASCIGYSKDSLGHMYLNIQAHIGHIKQYKVELLASQIDHITPLTGQVDIWLRRTIER